METQVSGRHSINDHRLNHRHSPPFLPSFSWPSFSICPIWHLSSSLHAFDCLHVLALPNNNKQWPTVSIFLLGLSLCAFCTHLQFCVYSVAFLVVVIVRGRLCLLPFYAGKAGIHTVSFYMPCFWPFAAFQASKHAVPSFPFFVFHKPHSFLTFFLASFQTLRPLPPLIITFLCQVCVTILSSPLPAALLSRPLALYLPSYLVSGVSLATF